MKKTVLYFFLTLFIALGFSGCGSSSSTNEIDDDNLRTVGHYKIPYRGYAPFGTPSKFETFIYDGDKRRVFRYSGFDFEWGYTYKVKIQIFQGEDSIEAEAFEVIKKEFTSDDFDIYLSIENLPDTSTYMEDNKYIITKISENRYRILDELNITVNDSEVASELDDMAVSIKAKAKCYFEFVVEDNKVKDIVMVKIERLE
jgi:hypothetical protein